MSGGKGHDSTTSYPLWAVGNSADHIAPLAKRASSDRQVTAHLSGGLVSTGELS
jgi:hypothetical protein